MHALRLVLKIIGALAIVISLCCVTLTKGRAAGQSGHQEQTEFNPTADCPDVSLLGIDKIDFTKIPALQENGIRGLPCDSGFASDGNDLTTNLQHAFDYYSWLTFIALNSPVSGKRIGDDAPTVWETFKQLPDVMRPNGRPPSDWIESPSNRLIGANNPIVPDECSTTFRSGMMVIHMEKELEETYNEPFKSGPLFDQNGNYALFVIFMNEQMFKYIQNPSHPLYTREDQEAFQGEVSFPNGSNGSKDHPEKTLGAIMIKASWKLMKEGVDFGKNVTPKYHMIDAVLYRPKAQDKCQPVKLGLIGFHVGHKTVSRQQWIWTTFEYHDNVPTEQDVKNGISTDATYNFYDPRCKTCPVNQTPTGSWDPDVLRWSPFPKNPTFRSQIVRTGATPVFPDDDVGRLNKKFHSAPQIHGKVWENYDLITTQWPSGHCADDEHPEKLSDATCAPFPTFLANTTLETFSQPQQATEMQGDKDAGIALATSSCISCHNNATTQHRPAKRSDFTYILEKAKSRASN